MPTFRIFLGAPSLSDIDNNTIDYQWQSVSSQSHAMREQFQTPPDFPAIEALDDASRRVSLIYQNVIFNEDIEERAFEEAEDEALVGIDQTTAITWPPTAEENAQGRSRSRRSLAEISFLNATTRSLIDSQYKTQGSQSVNYSDASSIACFPTFHFNLHALASITQLVKHKITKSAKISALLAVLEVEGPDIIRLKSGKEAGKEVTILKMILGDECGTICRLTAWREVAQRWSGQQENAVAVKRGDVVLFENVTFSYDLKTSPAITASPFLNSTLTICYRTMPYAKTDSILRPDLRLGQSDATVRKVAALVTWFQRLVGLDNCQ